jgi:hypothetical protein
MSSEQLPHHVRGFEHSSQEDAYVKAYLEGNLRMPQTAIGMTLSLARAMASAPEIPERVRLSPRGLKALKTSMERAHAAHGVPDVPDDSEKKTARHLRVPDARFRQLYKFANIGALAFIAAALGREDLNSETQGYLIGDELAIKLWEGGEDDPARPLKEFVKNELKDERKRTYVLSMLDAMYDSLTSPEGNELAKKWRENVRDVSEAALGMRGELRQGMVKSLISGTEKRGLSLSGELKEVLSSL